MTLMVLGIPKMSGGTVTKILLKTHGILLNIDKYCEILVNLVKYP